MDRNIYVVGGRATGKVALRKESVDRNMETMRTIAQNMVALRKESVDRNLKPPALQAIVVGRSPQGERG